MVILYCLPILPIDAIEPTPFQRDLSDTHHKRLADVITKTGRYLDPVMCRGGADSQYSVHAPMSIPTNPRCSPGLR